MCRRIVHGRLRAVSTDRPWALTGTPWNIENAPYPDTAVLSIALRGTCYHAQRQLARGMGSLISETHLFVVCCSLSTRCSCWYGNCSRSSSFCGPKRISDSGHSSKGNKGSVCLVPPLVFGVRHGAEIPPSSLSSCLSLSHLAISSFRCPQRGLTDVGSGRLHMNRKKIILLMPYAHMLIYHRPGATWGNQNRSLQSASATTQRSTTQPSLHHEALAWEVGAQEEKPSKTEGQGEICICSRWSVGRSVGSCLFPSFLVSALRKAGGSRSNVPTVLPARGVDVSGSRNPDEGARPEAVGSLLSIDAGRNRDNGCAPVLSSWLLLHV